MYRLIASFFGSWRTHADERWGNAAFTAVTLLFVPYAQTLLEPRTIFMTGFVPDARWLQIVILWCAIISACPVRLRTPLNARLWRWAFPLAAAALWTSRAVAVSCVLAAGVAALSWGKHVLVERLRSRIYAATWAWTLATLAGNVYQHIEARVWISAPLTLALKVALQLLGVQVNAADDQIAIHTHGLTTLILPSFDKFGGIYLLASVACLFALCGLLVFPTRRVVYAAVGLASYSLLRAAWNLVDLAGKPSPAWWVEDHLLQTFAPFAIICFWLLLVLQPDAADTRSDQPSPQSFLPFVCGFAGLLLLLAGWFYTDPGMRKHGVIVMDESHCQWEQSTTPIDTEWFGSRTVYNYYNFAEALNHYYPTRINNGPLDDAALADASVLILKTPTKPYNDVSLAAIRRFVTRGGGLWLIGDHTDAFGMSTYLNTIAAPYGLEFRKDAYVEPPIQRNLWQPGPYSHPTLRRLPLFLFYTGCSLGSGWLDNDVISAGRQLVDPPDYSAGTFFGTLDPVLSDRVANVTMATEVQRGAGRIALWSDSTLFSNFSIFVPGKMEVALYTIDWLNRQNSTPNTRLILLVVGAALLLASMRFLRVDSLLLIGLTSASAMPLLLSAWAAWKFPPAATASSL